MAAGNVITKYLGYQDFRRMGGSPLFTTLESLILIISLACLGGLPFTLGFFNKHYLLNLVPSVFIFVANMFTISAAFTGLFYSVKTIRSLFFTIYKQTNSHKKSIISGLAQNKEAPYIRHPAVWVDGIYRRLDTFL